MPTLNEIQQQIKSLGEVYIFHTMKEIRYLPDILSDNEIILALTSGQMDGNTWLIIATNTRVIFLDKGLLYGLKQRETPLEKINSIEQKIGMMFGSIGIWDGAAHMEMKYLAKWSVRPFVEAVNRARAALKTAERGGKTSAASPSLDVVSQLERLANLRDRGVLSDDDFQIQKNKILGA